MTREKKSNTDLKSLALIANLFYSYVESYSKVLRIHCQAVLHHLKQQPRRKERRELLMKIFKNSYGYMITPSPHHLSQNHHILTLQFPNLLDPIRFLVILNVSCSMKIVW